MSEAYICDYVRSPFGRYGGALRDVRADDLAAHPLQVLMGRHRDFDWAAVNALETNGGKRAIAAICIGVEQGIAVLIERV